MGVSFEDSTIVDIYLTARYLVCRLARYQFIVRLSIFAMLLFSAATSVAYAQQYIGGVCKVPDGQQSCTTTTNGAPTVCTQLGFFNEYFLEGGAANVTECKTTYSDGTVCTILDKIAGQDDKGCKKGGELVAEGTQDRSAVQDVVIDPAVEGLKDLGADIVLAVSFFVLMFANFMLGLAGTLFNWVLLVAVFQFGIYFGNSQAVLLAWGVLRDLANIAILFGFIFMGLQTILDIGHFNVKKALPRLLIVAILLNFSLFITEALIDTSNVFSAVMATQAGAGCDPKTSGTAGMDKCVQYGIAGKIMTGTGLAAMFDPNLNSQSYTGEKQRPAAIYLGAALFSAVGAIVLFAGALMLIIRAVTLVLVMVLSPLGFAAMALPQFEEAGNKWKKALVGNILSAPVYILMILISLKIAEGFQTTDTVNGVPSLMAGLAAQNVSALGVMLIYFIIISFLVAAMVLSKQVGAMGASFATKAGAGIVIGGGAFAARRTVGYGASVLAKTIRKNNPGFARTGLGRGVIENIEKAGGVSYDARASIGGLAKGVGLDIGKAGKGGKKGYKGIVEEEAKKTAKYAATLQQSEQEAKDEKNAKEAQEFFKGEIKNMEKDGKKQEREFMDEEFKARRAMQESLEPDRQELIRKKGDLDAARASGAPDVEAKEAAFRNDTEAYNAKKEAAQKVLDAELKAIDDRRALDREAREAEKEQYGKYLEQEAKDEKKAKDAPQQQYADMLTAQANTPWASLSPTLSQEVSLEGAKMIVAELKKSKTDKKLEKIEAAIEKGSKITKEELDDVSEDIEKEKPHT